MVAPHLPYAVVVCGQVGSPWTRLRPCGSSVGLCADGQSVSPVPPSLAAIHAARPCLIPFGQGSLRPSNGFLGTAGRAVLGCRAGAARGWRPFAMSGLHAVPPALLCGSEGFHGFGVGCGSSHLFPPVLGFRSSPAAVLSEAGGVGFLDAFPPVPYEPEVHAWIHAIQVDAGR